MPNTPTYTIQSTHVYDVQYPLAYSQTEPSRATTRPVNPSML